MSQLCCLLDVSYCFTWLPPHNPVHFSVLTRPSKMSLWCTWIVINVSYLIRSTGLRSFVVISINVFRRSRKNWFVFRIIFLSYLALVKASSESLVQIIWIPNNPTLGNIKWYASSFHFPLKWTFTDTDSNKKKSFYLYKIIFLCFLLEVTESTHLKVPTPFINIYTSLQFRLRDTAYQATVIQLFNIIYIIMYNSQ